MQDISKCLIGNLNSNAPYYYKIKDALSGKSSLFQLTTKLVHIKYTLLKMGILKLGYSKTTNSRTMSLAHTQLVAKSRFCKFHRNGS